MLSQRQLVSFKVVDNLCLKGEESLKLRPRSVKILNRVRIYNSLLKLIDAVHQVLYSLRDYPKLAMKRPASTINNTLFLGVIKIVSIISFILRRREAYSVSNGGYSGLILLPLDV